MTARAARSPLEAVRSAAAPVPARSGRRSRRTCATAKADRSPVTVADLGAQVLISLALADGLPGRPADGRGGRLPAARRRPAASATRSASVSRRCARASTRGRSRGRSTRCADAGGPTRPLVDARPGRRHQGLPARRAVRDRAGARRGRRGRPLGVLGCPNLRACRRVASGSLFVAERGGGAWELPLDGRRGPPSAHPRRAPSPTATRGALRRIARGRRTRPRTTRRASRELLGIDGAAAAPGQPGQVRRWWRVATRRSTCASRAAATSRTSGTTPRARSWSRRPAGVVSDVDGRTARLHRGPAAEPQPGHRRGAGRHPRRGRRRGQVRSGCRDRLIDRVAVDFDVWADSASFEAAARSDHRRSAPTGRLLAVEVLRHQCRRRSRATVACMRDGHAVRHTRPMGARRSHPGRSGREGEHIRRVPVDLDHRRQGPAAGIPPEWATQEADITRPGARGRSARARGGRDRRRRRASGHRLRAHRRAIDVGRDEGDCPANCPAWSSRSSGSRPPSMRRARSADLPLLVTTRAREDRRSDGAARPGPPRCQGPARPLAHGHGDLSRRHAPCQHPDVVARHGGRRLVRCRDRAPDRGSGHAARC